VTEAPLQLSTPRLTLVAATSDLARAELAGRAVFAARLGAAVPETWPPPLNDEASMTWIAEILEADPGAAGWVAWYFLLRGPADARTAIGTGGFKGRPSSDGMVEVGYSVLEDHQRRGYAPEAVEALSAWAFAHEAVRRIVAHTLPDGVPSQRVLAKCGFRLVGPGLEEGTVLFERLRGSRRAGAERSTSAP
jgi:RimJ/RimL family protein N-acetyltransferase